MWRCGGAGVLVGRVRRGVGRGGAVPELGGGAGSAEDERDVRVVEHPAERGLRERLDVVADEEGEGFGVGHAGFDLVAAVAGVEVALLEVGVARDRAGEEPVCERLARHDPDALRAEVGDEVRRLPVHQAVDHLHHVDLALGGPRPRHPLRVLELRDRVADDADLAFVFQLRQFLPHVVVDLVGAEGRVEEEHIHVVRAEAAQAALDGLAGALRVEVRRGVFGRVAPELGRDQHASRSAPSARAEDLFGDAVALGVAVERGRVEERDAGVEGGADRRVRRRTLATSP